MKRVLLIILCSASLINTLLGIHVDTTAAKTVASNFYLSRISQRDHTLFNKLISEGVKLQLVYQETEERNDVLRNITVKESLPLYYVFNVAPYNGFVIVAADDRIIPVLGYALQGAYSDDNQPPAFVQWMTSYKEQIRNAVVKDAAIYDEAQLEWNRYRNSAMLKSESPLKDAGPLLTTTWDQGQYYNTFCPLDERGEDGRVYVGCVAIAMGQIMRYMQHPAACSFIPGYDEPLNYSSGNPIEGTAYGHLPDVQPTTYNWFNMPDALNAGSTSTQIDAVSQFLYHCGVSVSMNYSPYGSGAYSSDARDALCNYFNYSSSAQFVNKADYAITDWQSLLIGEIDAQRPVFYRGSGTGGHAFVCDGYQGADYFHFNWGWSGSEDGYFYLNDLTPGSYTFNEGQGAIVGIYPDYSESCPNITPINGYGPGFEQTFTGGGSGQWFTTNSNACGFASTGTEKMYSFVAPVTGTYSIQVTGANGFVDYMWKTGSCSLDGWTCIDDISAAGTYGTMSWTAGITYYIMLDDENSTSGTHTFYINCPPDPCNTTTAIIGCGSDYSQTYTGGGSGQWFTSIGNACDYPTPGTEQIYSFVAPESGTYSIQVTAANGYVDYLWKTGSCSEGGWACIADINSTGMYGAMSWTAGTTYYLLLDDEDGLTGTHTFYIACGGTNDPCANITAINGCGSGNAQTFTGGGAGMWFNTAVNPCEYTSPGLEKIYSFVAPTTGTYSLQVTAASGFVDYLWKSGSCSSDEWTCIDDVNSVGVYGAMSWTAGTTYYILLDDENSTAGAHTFYFDCGGSTDPCANVTAINGCGSGYALTYTGGGTGQWFNTINNPCGYSSPGTEKIYSFIAPSTGTYSIQVTAASGYVEYLWKSGSCSSDGWMCIDDINSIGAYGAMSWTAGTTYYILLDDENNATGIHTFYINCLGGSDPCNNITTINDCGSGYAQTFTGGGTGQWFNSSSNACGYLSPGLEKIYSFVAPTTGNYSVQVTAASGYVDYLWKTGSCSSSGWTCIDDVNAAGVYGSISWTAGTTYYILLDDENSTSGTHTFYINCPGGSDPCNSITAINSCGSGYAQTYTGGGYGQWFNSTSNACGYVSPGIEKIYSFVAPSTGTYSIQVTAASGYVDYLWKSGSCSSGGWICIDDVIVAGAYGSMSWTAGTTYYLLLEDENSTAGTHTFYINCPGGPDPCASITTINGCGTGYEQTYTGGGSGAWNSGFCGYSTPGAEKIYGFTAPVTGTYSIQVTTANGFVDYAWSTLSCAESGWNCIDDINTTGTYGSMNWTAGLTYYILLDDEDGTTGTHEFFIKCPVPYLEVLPPTKEVSSAAGTTSYSVNSNVEWSVSDNADWLAATKTNPTTISVNYEANPLTASRTATITASGPESISESVTLKQNGIQSNINEINDGQGLTIFPNPARDKLLVNTVSDIDSKLVISVSDNIGRLLYFKEYSTLSSKELIEIDVSDYAYGIYFLKISTSNSLRIEKFIKE